MNNFNKQELELISIPLPAKEGKYVPVSHQQLIETTLEELDKNNLYVTTRQYNVASNGQRIIAKYGIQSLDSEMEIMLAFTNSYDKSMTVGYAAGARVFVCSNGAISGTLSSYKRKHMGTVQTELTLKISEAINSVQEEFEQLKQDRDLFKQVTLDLRTKAELLGRLYIEKEILLPNQVATVRNEIITPTFDYGAKDSLWEFYNYGTFALKDSSPVNYIKKHTELHKFIKDYIEIEDGKSMVGEDIYAELVQ
jgi:hypothetical protein